MDRFSLITKISAYPGERDTLSRVMRDVATLMKKTEGCVRYDLHEDFDDENLLWITEIWQRQDHHDRSLMVEGICSLLTKAQPMIITIDVIRLKNLND